MAGTNEPASTSKLVNAGLSTCPCAGSSTCRLVAGIDERVGSCVECEDQVWSELCGETSSWDCRCGPAVCGRARRIEGGQSEHPARAACPAACLEPCQTARPAAACPAPCVVMPSHMQNGFALCHMFGAMPSARLNSPSYRLLHAAFWPCCAPDPMSIKRRKVQKTPGGCSARFRTNGAMFSLLGVVGYEGGCGGVAVCSP